MKNTKKSILVISAHPDDETIGCGGTIAKHISQGDSVYALSFTDGISSREAHADRTTSKDRVKASEMAAELLGFSWISRGEYPDNMLDTIPVLDLAKNIEAVKRKYCRHIIYTHSYADLNVDHRKVHEATLIAFRPQPKETWQEIRAYEVASSTEWGMQSFTPNLFINIDEFIEIKKEALACYWMELRDTPHPRSISSIECINRVRGSQAGFNYSEAFEIIKSRGF